MKENYICPVCGYEGLYEPPYNIYGYGSDEICPCCGFQFGYDDYPNKDEAIYYWRLKWIDDGFRWFSKKRKPPLNWNGENQLK